MTKRNTDISTSASERAIQAGKARQKRRIFLHNAFIALLCVIWIIPIVWLVCTSFSAYSGMNTSTFFPEKWSAIHYVKLLTPDTVNQFPTWFWNTFVIACWTCVISTLFVIMVAYAMSVTRFKSRKALMNAAVLMNLFPGMLSMIAVSFTLKTFGLTNSHIGLILVYSASAGLGYLVAKGFFDTVPRALCEAARIDGATGWQTLIKVKIPNVMPSITICMFLTLTNSFKLFDQNLALTGGDPNHSTEMLALNIYNNFYARSGAAWKGIGQAKAVVFCLMVIAISMIQLKATRSKEVQQ